MAIYTLVDSNVLIDMLWLDPAWGQWSSAAMADAADEGKLVINQIVYAEVSTSFADISEFDAVLDEHDLIQAAMPWSAAFLAGKVHRDYRGRGGTKTATLPDFFIGAHAAVSKLRLLTRDSTRYRTYFPTVELLAP